MARSRKKSVEEKGSLPRSYLKVLATVEGLSTMDLAPSRDGIKAVLHGNQEYGAFFELETFGSLVSVGSKKLGAILHQLSSKGLLIPKWVEEQEETYYFLSKEGKEVANLFLSRYHKPAQRPNGAKRSKFIPIADVFGED